MKSLKKKDLFLLATKISDLRNAKEHYQLFIRKKNTKSVKQSEITTYQPKTYKNFFQKLLIKPKTISQAEKVGFNSLLYSDTKKFFKRKKYENNKTSKL